jgi:hypothetical protein
MVWARNLCPATIVSAFGLAAAFLMYLGAVAPVRA